MRTLSEFRSSANDRAESADAEDWLGVMMQYVLCLGVALANLLVPCSLTILPLMPYLDRPKTGGIKLQRSGAQALSGYQLDEDVVNARP
jgi:hypothetical protein